MAIRGVFDLPTMIRMRTHLHSEQCPWVDGRNTAGHQGVLVKQNYQLDPRSELAKDLGSLVLAALNQNSEFVSSALPHRIFPPMFNRYDEGMRFGEHIDGAIRQVGPGLNIRADLSATIFLTDPLDYDGGELVVDQGSQIPVVKLAAGSMILYSAGTRHRIEPVTRGTRLAVVLWVESMIRDDGQRKQLLELDQAIQLLTAQDADPKALIMLTSHYHNLLRRWAEV